MSTLEKYQPTIGLDIYRDVSVEPGKAELTTRLELSDPIFAICKVGDASTSGVAPPPVIPENRLGFSDVLVDSGGIVRRGLLYQTPEKNSKCPANQALSLQLALNYLEKQGIKPQLTPQEYLKLGSTVFQPLKEHTVGYQNVDARGYQILLNYRSPANVAQQITLSEVLNNRFDRNLVRDRLVLIGVTATSSNDYFYTPYSRGQQDLRMPGVLIHAQIASQILSAVLDGRKLIWFFPSPVEGLWIWVWALIGGCFGWRLRPLVLGVSVIVALVGLGIISYVILSQAGWVPIVTPALALVGTAVSVISYKISQEKHSEPISSSQVIRSNSHGGEGTNILPEPTQNSQLLLKGRYTITAELGAGGFGKTYLAQDTQRPGSPQCVVKQLKPMRTDERTLEISRRLFQQEAEMLEKLGKHSQIPQLLAYFEQNQEFYLVQEFVKGHPLSAEMFSGKRLSEIQVVYLLKDVLSVLNFIHTQGVIHRDIKPANIIRREQDGKLVLIDFGAVKQKLQESQLVEGQESVTIGIGTVGYAPSEQLKGQPKFNSDIYALGITAIQALTGQVADQLPTDPQTAEIVWRNYASVSDRLANVLDQMVRHHHSARYQSAAEVLQALKDL